MQQKRFVKYIIDHKQRTAHNGDNSALLDRKQLFLTDAGQFKQQVHRRVLDEDIQYVFVQCLLTYSIACSQG